MANILKILMRFYVYWFASMPGFEARSDLEKNKCILIVMYERQVSLFSLQIDVEFTSMVSYFQETIEGHHCNFVRRLTYYIIPHTSTIV